MNTDPYNLLEQQQNILIAGSDKADIGAIAARLSQNGYSIQRVHNGKDAIQSWHDSPPDLVILDADLTIFDVLDVAGRIKKDSWQDKYIPVMLLADEADQIMLYEMAACGIDDIFIRPINANLVAIKVALLDNLQAQVNTLKSSYQALFSAHSKLQYEYDAAEQLFLKITPALGSKPANVKCHMSPQSLSNGDIFLFEVSPGGDQYFFLGDFTGHGLVAALGACSIKDAFAELAQQEAGLSNIVDAVNDRLMTILPPELFAASCLLHYKKAEHGIEIWNGGIPSVHIYNKHANSRKEIRSNHPPLGIEKYKEKHLVTQNISLKDDDRILIMSDGLIEARDKHGHMFGGERVESCVEANMKADDVYDKLYDELLQHRAGKIQSDDVTLIEIRY